MNEFDDPTLLRQYLLGTLDDVVRTQIEERLMKDEQFAARVSVAEEELTEEFIDGEMNAEDSEKFNRFFLSAPERKQQLRMTRSLRRIAASDTPEAPHPETSRSTSIFSIGWLRFAFAGAALLLVAFGIWRFAIYKSDTDRGLEQLQAAYRDRRPVEPRITGLDYAPYSETRGGESRVTDPAALDRANRYLVDASTDPKDAAAHHALALYHLAAGDLEKAEREMDIALQGLPENARVQSDAGAMYLERARRAGDEKDDAKEVIALSESKKHLDLAISLRPDLLEPRFNLALTLQKFKYTEEAKKAWRQYMERDPNSKWAEEARGNLDRLERSTPKERSAEELETDFLAAFRQGNEKEASALIAANRELIRDKYLATRLSMRVLAAPEEKRDELLKALAYNGEIEMKLTGDPFAKEIAHFYKTASTSKWNELKIAHDDLREGYRLCLALQYQDGVGKFQSSQRAFEKSGDVYNAGIAGYGVGYALFNVNLREDARREFESVESWANAHGFPWLRVTALHWIGACLMDAKRLTDARHTYELAITIAEQINDTYARQRNLAQLGLLNSISGLEQEALKNLFAAIKESDKPETSLRQRCRNLFLSLPVLFRAKLYNAAMPAAMEVIDSADRVQDQQWAALARAFAGIAAVHLGETELARRLLTESREKAAAIEAPGVRDSVSALTNLRSADLERALGNYDESEKFYNAALLFYNDPSRPTFLREEANQGLLLNQIAAHRTDQLEEQILKTIEETEEYRAKIVDEAQNIGFFDLNANLYEIGSEFELERANVEQAYEYAEGSSARTLLKMIQRSATSDSDQNADKSYPTAKEKLLDLNGIRQALPVGVRIVQYSVFERKTVAWLISRDSFNAITITVDAGDLLEKVSQFTKAVSRPVSAGEDETRKLGQELHRLLIAPLLSQLDPNDELCIIPSKFLFDLPFASLIDPEGNPLISKFRLIYAPSANVFVAATTNATARGEAREETMLAVGNSTFDRSRFDLKYLPDSEDEVERISALYHSTPLLRENATKDAFLKALPQADVVHIAGHYVAMPGAPMSSFFLMAADGQDPSASELSNLELTQVELPRTRLMILAACRSGVESYYRSEGMAGMSRTVLRAQVPLAVASQWNVDSTATSELMVRFHEYRRRDRLSTTAALRQAQLDLINDPSRKFSSPYYWAAFAAYGGHANY